MLSDGHRLAPWEDDDDSSVGQQLAAAKEAQEVVRCDPGMAASALLGHFRSSGPMEPDATISSLLETKNLSGASEWLNGFAIVRTVNIKSMAIVYEDTTSAEVAQQNHGHLVSLDHWGSGSRYAAGEMRVRFGEASGMPDALGALNATNH